MFGRAAAVVLDTLGQAILDRRWGRAPIENLGVCEGRLTLTTLTPFLTSTVTGATSVYWTPYKGNRVKLYDKKWKQWAPRTFSEISVAVPSTLFRLFDVWAYWTGSAVALDTTSWNQSTGTITGVTSATPAVVTSNGHGLSNGDLVGIAGIVGTAGTNSGNGLNGTVWTVANVAANTFECEGSDTSALVYTSDGTWYKVPNTRATALVLQDGVYCKTGDVSRRYLGTCMTTGTSGQTECVFGAAGTAANWLLWNYYNRGEVILFAGETANSWTYTTATWHAINSHGKLQRLGFVRGVAEHPGIQAEHNFCVSNSAGSGALGGLDLDGFSATDTKLMVDAYLSAPQIGNSWYEGHPGAGCHYLGLTEYSEAGGISTWYGDDGRPTLVQTGAWLKLWA